MNIDYEIRKYLNERFGDYTNDLSDQDSLEYIIDSLGLFELVTFLEENFSLSIPEEDFSPELFMNIENIKSTIHKYS